ncbi:MAG: DNA gyrase inhibitor YacG [Planctomycetes bacterium]|nr:DNA gyrase inhibitor YacG [Planctomycetota bacterium]
MTCLPIRNPQSEIPMRCLICNREFEKSTSPALPFCSERCRTIDLGRWLGETYGFPVAPDPEADELPDEGDLSSGNGTKNKPL